MPLGNKYAPGRTKIGPVPPPSGLLLPISDPANCTRPCRRYNPPENVLLPSSLMLPGPILTTVTAPVPLSAIFDSRIVVPLVSLGLFTAITISPGVLLLGPPAVSVPTFATPVVPLPL